MVTMYFTRGKRSMNLSSICGDSSVGGITPRFTFLLGSYWLSNGDSHSRPYLGPGRDFGCRKRHPLFITLFISTCLRYSSLIPWTGVAQVRNSLSSPVCRYPSIPRVDLDIGIACTREHLQPTGHRMNLVSFAHGEELS